MRNILDIFLYQGRNIAFKLQRDAIKCATELQVYPVEVRFRRERNFRLVGSVRNKEKLYHSLAKPLSGVHL